jgi:hypothetical protein
MNIVHIDNLAYYDYQDICVKHPGLVKGCRTKKQFIDRKLKDGCWIYGRKVKGTDEWIESDGKGKKVDTLLVRVNWFKNNLLNKSIHRPPLPETLELEDEENFRDEDGNILNIHVVGERDMDKCFFSARDVGNSFGLINLLQTIRNKDRGYEENIHYYCYFEKIIYSDKKIIGEKIIKKMYLTYTGVLKVLFSSRNGITKPFISWATKILFTAQMGTPTQKMELASSLSGLSPQTIKEISSATSGTTPCIYLFSIGTVADLRKKMAIDKRYKSTDMVYKYGRTNDLFRRTKEHENTFNKIKGSDLKLVYHGYIDIQYTVEAEGMVREMMNGLNCAIEFESSKELVIIPKGKVTYVRRQYDMITDRYQGRVKELVDQIKRIEQKYISEKDIMAANHRADNAENSIKLMEQKNRADNAENNSKLMEKDIQLMEQKNRADNAENNSKLMEKDMEILKLQLLIAQK